MARLLRVPVAALEPGERTLDPSAGRYVARVHRLAAGDRFVAFDPEQRLEADGEIVATTKREVRCRLSAPRVTAALPPATVTLLQGLGKGDKPDAVVRDATALGVARVVLVESEHAVVRLGDRAGPRRRRWRAIAVEAARQSGRGDVPAIDGPVVLDDALERVRADGGSRLRLDATAARPLAAVLADQPPHGSVVLVVGPEGGLSEAESARADGLGYAPVTLGRFVLRTETAATAALGAVVSRW